MHLLQWRKLTVGDTKHFKAYAGFLSSKFNAHRLQHIRTLVVSKPIESRHTHHRPLPFSTPPNLQELYTKNLCLSEIKFLTEIYDTANMPLTTLVCTDIETWCDYERFDYEMFFPTHALRRVEFRFIQDGGFGSVHGNSCLRKSHQELPTKIRHLVISNIRDEQAAYQREILGNLEGIENDRVEINNDIQMVLFERQKNREMRKWDHYETELIKKYQFLSSLNFLERFEFGYCYAWTPAMWRECFGKAIKASPFLSRLVLNGWDQLGKLEKAGSQSSTIQPIRIDAEDAIAECFEFMNHLTRLKLIDFSIGTGLLKSSTFISKSIQRLDIVFTKSFLRHFTEVADIWLLLGPLKEFVLDTFSKQSDIKRTVTIRLHPDLMIELKRHPFFIEEPLLESIQIAVQDPNVKVDLLEYIPE